MSKTEQKFFELIRPDINFDFVGRQATWVRISWVLVVLSLAVLPINAFLLKDRGNSVNWGVDFRGGSEMLIELSKPVPDGQIRAALESAGHDGAEIAEVGARGASGPARYRIRIGSTSVVSDAQAKRLDESLRAAFGPRLKDGVQWSEGRDRVLVRLGEPLPQPEVEKLVTTAGVQAAGVQAAASDEGRDGKAYEITLVGLERAIRALLDEKLGAGTVSAIPSVESVGPKAGQQLRDDAIKALFAAMLLIMLYVAVRFDIRYAPATVVGLLHDTVIMLGVFAATYRELSLTTVAAFLTLLGFSVNDKIVVFDRIREISSRSQGSDFRRAVNQALNQTLSRTIITNSTVFLVTVAMNVFASGAIREFAFAMNVGVIVSTYSSIFIATPMVIWLNDRVLKTKTSAGRRPAPSKA